MKKKFIRAIGFVVAVLTLFSVMSCGGSGANTAATTAAATTVAAATTAAAAATTAAAADTAAATTAAAVAETTAAAAVDDLIEPITLTIFSGGTDPGTWAEDPVHQFIREKLGVDIERIYTTNDSGTQLNLWLAAGNYPDAISQKYGTDVINYVAGDHIVDLTDYYPKYLPRLLEMPDKYNNPRLFNFDIPGFSDKIWFIPCQLGSE